MTKEEKVAYMMRWRAENKDRLREYTKQYRKNNESYRRRKLEYGRKYYHERIKNKPEIRKGINQAQKQRYQSLSESERKALYRKRAKYLAEYRKKNKSRLAEAQKDNYEKYIKEYRADNRQRYRENPLPYIRRARKRMAFLVGTYTKDEIDALYRTQNSKCAGCGKSLNHKYEIDHVMPLALDPTGDRIENLQLLCRPCNRSKHTKHPDIWAKRLGRLFV
jgi:5-methylcytosine-specific restriction endonuclease McrA